MSRPAITDAQLADAGRVLAEAVRSVSWTGGTEHVALLAIQTALVAYDATVTPPVPPRLSVVLPSTYLARDVTLRIGKDGSRWIIEAEDAHGQLYDVQLDGFTGPRVRFATQRAAATMLEQHGSTVGSRFWAVRS